MIKLPQNNGGSMEDDERITAMSFEEEENPFPESQDKAEEKKPRKRKTVEEQLQKLSEDEAKEKARHAKKEATFAAKRERLTLTAKERKVARKKAEDHCKIIAGVTAFELAKKGGVFFTLENFKKRLYSELTQPHEINFLNRVFNAIERK